MKDPTVFLIDDDPVLLESIAVVVRSMGLKALPFVSGIDFLNQFDPQVPGVVILEVRMKHISGLAVQEQLRKEQLCPPIIFLTAHADVPTVIRAFRQGAVGLLQKMPSENELRQQIQDAIARDGDDRRKHTKQMRSLARLALLTMPERQVLDLILRGFPNKTIATTLAVSRRTVEDRRTRLAEKLEVDSLPALVRFATEAGLRPSDEPKAKASAQFGFLGTGASNARSGVLSP